LSVEFPTITSVARDPIGAAGRGIQTQRTLSDLVARCANLNSPLESGSATLPRD